MPACEGAEAASPTGIAAERRKEEPKAAPDAGFPLRALASCC